MYQKRKFKAMQQSSMPDGFRKKRRSSVYSSAATVRNGPFSRYVPNEGFDRDWPSHLDPSIWERHPNYGFVRKDTRGAKPTSYVHIARADDARKSAIQVAAEWVNRTTVVTTDGNLVGDEYRFWLGTPNPDSLFARCRACGVTVCGKQQMKEHQKETGCTTMLIEAYKLLALDKVCVVCDGDTLGNEKWGVALCAKSDCLKAWMYSIKMRFPSLDAAMVLALPHIPENKISEFWKRRRAL